MGDDQVWYSAANVPVDIPTHDKIVSSCGRAGFNRNDVYIQVAGKPRFWVKYGKDNSDILEARLLCGRPGNTEAEGFGQDRK
jgi:hypothetical protein